jgi:hypothetical protein
VGKTLDEAEGLARRFPEHSVALRRLYMRDPDFRAVCKEYTEAVRAHAHWSEKTSQTDAAGMRQLHDYADLMHELEEETLAILARDQRS